MFKDWNKWQDQQNKREHRDRWLKANKESLGIKNRLTNYYFKVNSQGLQKDSRPAHWVAFCGLFLFDLALILRGGNREGETARQTHICLLDILGLKLRLSHSVELIGCRPMLFTEQNRVLIKLCDPNYNLSNQNLQKHQLMCWTFSLCKCGKVQRALCLWCNRNNGSSYAPPPPSSRIP